LPALSYVLIFGFATPANNGVFRVDSVTPTTLILQNAGGVAETPSAAASIFPNAWNIPDAYINIYNNMFLAEALAITDDPRSQLYRQRSMAALLAAQDGLQATQKNIFAQQAKSNEAESERQTLSVQQAVQTRAI
jgi:hypothetical protein